MNCSASAASDPTTQLMPEPAMSESSMPESPVSDSEMPQSDLSEPDQPKESAISQSAMSQSAMSQSAISESTLPESTRAEAITPESVTPESAPSESVMPESETSESKTSEQPATPTSSESIEPAHRPNTRPNTMADPPMWFEGSSSRRFLERFQRSLQPADTQEPDSNALVFHAYGVRGVGKSSLLKQCAKTVQGNVAAVSFAESALETPISLMVHLFEELAEHNNWIFRPKFLVMYERYARALEELQTLPLAGATQVSQAQLNQCQQLVKLAQNSNLLVPEECSTAATVAQANRREKVENLLHQHRATQHDQALQNLLQDPLGVMTVAFADALQKRSKRQPLVLIFDDYEKASLAIDTWFWHLFLTQPAIQNSRVKIVMASQTALLNRQGWRTLHRDRPTDSPLIVEQEIEPLNQAETHDFWQQINPTGSIWPSEELFAATEGLFYALNCARKRQPEDDAEKTAENYEPDSLLENSPVLYPPTLTHLLEDGLSLIQRYLVQLAACCRSFNRDLIEYLLVSQDSNFALAVQAESNGFDWLIQQDFVEQIGGCWQLNDLTRNKFRESLFASDEALFCQIQQQLADYFWLRSNEVVTKTESPRQQYRNQVWQRARAEYLYHQLLSQNTSATNQLLQHFLEGHYLGVDTIIQELWTTLTTEYPLMENPFLEKSAQAFLLRLQPAIAFAPLILDREAIPYERLDQDFGLSEETIDQAVQTCLQPELLLDTPLAQFVRLFYESKQCLEGEQITLLKQAKGFAEAVVVESDPEFSAQLFLWKLGDRYSSLGAYEAAIEAYEKALDYQPENAEAWDNRGSSLGCLGQYEAAIASFDKALELDPEAHDAWHSRGLALAKAERYEEAIASFEQALDIKPYKHEPWYDKACCYALQHRPKLALECLEQAIALNSRYRKTAGQDPDLRSIRDTLTFERLMTSNLTPQSLDS